MSVSSLDWSQISCRFGGSGKTTVEKMVGLLGAHSFSVTYHSDTGKFSIQGSSKVDTAAIRTILLGAKYKVWAPQVLDETDSLGDRLVVLIESDADTTGCSDEEDWDRSTPVHRPNSINGYWDPDKIDELWEAIFP